jgi:vacuolar-type H+-ATPase subunit D/Vma8
MKERITNLAYKSHFKMVLLKRDHHLLEHKKYKELYDIFCEIVNNSMEVSEEYISNMEKFFE